MDSETNTLQHPKLVMTILHCAMNSVQESLYNGLPMVCVPHGFDHFDVATRVTSAQVGIPLYSITDSLIHGRVSRQKMSPMS